MKLLFRIWAVLNFLAVLTSADRCYGISVSVIVPCYYKHFEHIPQLLEHLSNQSQIPDEVVISLSEAYRVSLSDIDSVKNAAYPFKLVFLTTSDVKFAGENRNIAAEAAQGDILITQDADDIPHIQRVEIITYFMEKLSADHIIHQWVKEGREFEKKSSNTPVWCEQYDSFENFCVNKITRIRHLLKYKWTTCGNIAIRKKIFEKVKWTRDKSEEDVKFNKEVIRKYKNTYFIQEPLLIYRQHLSSSRR
ncbi:MAG: glycosyltransferase [Chlamydiota bacterium]|nr:glycosyltransferase [Chlamydiota bacterium]